MGINFENYKRFGLDYLDKEIKAIKYEGYSESGRVKILDCGCVYLDKDRLEESCEEHTNISELKQEKIQNLKIKIINEINNAFFELEDEQMVIFRAKKRQEFKTKSALIKSKLKAKTLNELGV